MRQLESSFANKVYPDYTAPYELSNQGRLNLPVCTSRISILLCVEINTVKIASLFLPFELINMHEVLKCS